MRTRESAGKRTSRKSSLSLVKSHLKQLSYSELEEVSGWIDRYRNEKIGDEELRLIKEREIVELRLKELREMDKKVNEF